jgi:Zn-dependent protease with chaperone function
MVKWMWLFGLILGVPVLGFVVAEGIQAYFNSELRSALRQQFADLAPEKISAATIDRLCEQRTAELREICSTNDNLKVLSASAIGAGAVGLMLLLGIRIAGSLSRSNRRLLLWVFKPGLYLTGIALIGLVLVHAGVAMAAIYYGESALVGRVHVFIIGAIGLGALAGVFAIVRNAFSLVRNAQTLVIGKTVSQSDAPDLWSRVQGIADRLGALHAENVVLGLDPNFFVTEADVVCLSGTCGGRTLYCSLPLMRILSLPEFDGVIGHELGHYKGLDTKFSQQFFPIYRGTANSIATLQETGGEGSGIIALLPAIAVFSYFLESFSVAESRISRARELAADKDGAVVSEVRTIASALIKVHAFSGFWAALQQAAAQSLQEGKAFANASKTYAEVAAAQAKPDVFEGIAETHLTHPTDSHPPLSVRLKSLGSSIDEAGSDALNIKPSPSAIDLLPEAEKLEEEISGAYQVILARRLGIDLDRLTETVPQETA